jgi:hypothetical protein
MKSSVYYIFFFLPANFLSVDAGKPKSVSFSPEQLKKYQTIKNILLHQLMRITNFACFIDKCSIVNETCTYKAMRNKIGNFTVAGTFMRPIPKLYLEIKNFIKGSSNAYRRGPVNIRHDLCVKESPSAGLIFHLIPALRPAYDQMVQRCPYNVSAILCL